MALLLYWVSYSMLRPILAPFFDQVGLTPGQSGAILMFQALPAFLLAVPIGYFTTHYGHTRLIACGGAGMFVGGALLSGPQSIVAYGVSQVLLGIGALAVWLSLQREMISARQVDEPPQERVARIARYTMIVVIGTVSGPPIGGLLVDKLGNRAAFIAFASLSVALALVYSFRQGPSARIESSGEGITFASIAHMYVAAAKLLRNRQLLCTLAVSFCALYLLDLQGVWSPLYYKEVGLSATQAGVILAVGPACGVVARFAFPVLIRRLNVGVMSAALLLLGGAGVGMVFLVDRMGPLVLFAALAGVGLGLAQPFTLELLARSTHEADHGAAVALRLMANRLSGWMDPLIFGWLLTLTTAGGALLISAGAIVVLGLAASLVLLRMR